MPPRSIRSAVLSFGLVTIPVRFYTATSSHSPHFHMVHEVCGSRIKQQLYCPVCERVVERSELVKGYEIEGHSERGGEYVTFTAEELEALESTASQTLDIGEFVPLDKVDPVYFESTYYLGPGDGGEKPYRLLVEAMRDRTLAAVVQFVWRGKENVAIVRARDDGLVLHTLFFADEVRDLGEIANGRKATVREAELRLAERLVDELRVDEFDPSKYEDKYRERLEEAARQKARGKTLEIAAPTERPARVIDLMDALKASLERKPPSKATAEKRGRAAASRRAGRARRSAKRGAA
jgi:DNA end-binding protein Ku